MALFAGFRSRERDIDSDIARVKPVFDAVQAALREAEKELQGLRPRLTDVGEDEAATRGKSRARYLGEEVDALQKVKQLLDGIVKPETPSASQK